MSEKKLNDEQFRCFLDLLICSDPWPWDAEDGSKEVLEGLANDEAEARGHIDWLDASYGLKRTAMHHCGHCKHGTPVRIADTPDIVCHLSGKVHAYSYSCYKWEKRK